MTEFRLFSNSFRKNMKFGARKNLLMEEEETEKKKWERRERREGGWSG
jgi:hypothetical protein